MLITDLFTQDIDMLFISKHTSEIEDSHLRAAHALLTEMCVSDPILSHVLHDYCMATRGTTTAILTAEEITATRTIDEFPSEEVLYLQRSAFLRSLGSAACGALYPMMTSIQATRVKIDGRGGGGFSQADFSFLRDDLKKYAARAAHLASRVGKCQHVDIRDRERIVMISEEIQAAARDALSALRLNEFVAPTARKPRAASLRVRIHIVGGAPFTSPLPGFHRFTVHRTHPPVVQITRFK